jgi:hypothetical protein
MKYKTKIPIESMAMLIHDLLTGDALDQLLAGIGKRRNDAQLERLAHTAVNIILGQA